MGEEVDTAAAVALRNSSDIVHALRPFPDVVGPDISVGELVFLSF